MLDFSEKLTRAPSTITPDDIRGLHAVGFADEDILDITLAVSYRNFINRVADALGVEPEPQVLTDQRLVATISETTRPHLTVDITPRDNVKPESDAHR